MSGYWWLVQVALWCVVVFQMLVALGLVFQFSLGRLSLRTLDMVDAGPPTLDKGMPAPNPLVLDIRTKVIRGLLPSGQGRPVGIVFLKARCSVCSRLARELNDCLSEDASIVAICEGSEAEALSLLSQIKNREIAALYDNAGQAAKLYGVATPPRAVLIDKSGVIRRYAQIKTAEDLKQELSAFSTPSSVV